MTYSPIPSSSPKGIIHPAIARVVWSDGCSSLSPYRFCNFDELHGSNTSACGYGCSQQLGLGQRLYVLDFAGGGAVHLLGMCGMWRVFQLVFHS